ncbi:hypothetical protein HLPR_20620 [Helicovermis profundi]|uniref:Transcriptional regulator n=1 Tax=Helicovermis profundi TaxID=3065157 RepID=A0AAU9E4Y1_9FIRM|nr:hypothetical protein HLPR_20620 [Clostridia bacterium S502]
MSFEIFLTLELFVCGVIHTNIKWIKEGFIEKPDVIEKILNDNIPECIKHT